MRWAKSYSIVDHQLLHGGYFHRLDHKALVLYFFLVVVGDREGRSFYSDATIMELLGFSNEEINMSRSDLKKEGLIDYRRPYWWVINISMRKENMRVQPIEPVPANSSEDQDSDRAYGMKCIQEIRKMLSEKHSM